jgi:hypothetical protein
MRSKLATSGVNMSRTKMLNTREPTVDVPEKLLEK